MDIGSMGGNGLACSTCLWADPK